VDRGWRKLASPGQRQLGNPYTTRHVIRPSSHPPPDGYPSPGHPLIASIATPSAAEVAPSVSFREPHRRQRYSYYLQEYLGHARRRENWARKWPHHFAVM